MSRLLPDDDRLRRLWLLYGVAVLLHVVLDPAVSYLAVAVFDVAVETNPLLAPAFEQGLVALVVVHLPLVGLVVVLLGALTYLFSIAAEPEATQLYWGAQLALGLLILWGLAVVGWNTWVLVTGG